MSNAMIKKVRAIRSKGKKQIIAVNEKLNAIAWELSSGNSDLNDPNVAKAITTLDEALETLQVATALLNTVAIDESILEEPAAPAPKAKRSFMSRKNDAPTVDLQPEMKAS